MTVRLVHFSAKGMRGPWSSTANIAVIALLCVHGQPAVTKDRLCLHPASDTVRSKTQFVVTVPYVLEVC